MHDLRSWLKLPNQNTISSIFHFCFDQTKLYTTTVLIKNIRILWLPYSNMWMINFWVLVTFDLYTTLCIFGWNLFTILSSNHGPWSLLNVFGRSPFERIRTHGSCPHTCGGPHSAKVCPLSILQYKPWSLSITTSKRPSGGCLFGGNKSTIFYITLVIAVMAMCAHRHNKFFNHTFENWEIPIVSIGQRN
jgi:hypothetical protein